VDAAEEYRKKAREAMERQKDSASNCCRLCGMVFMEGAEVSDPSTHGPRTVAQEADGKNGERD
jgi:hypothetical protein